jgi:glycosyltransferase involved in cell wall biosynthesis
MTADAIGGVWRYCMDLTAGLVDDGVHVLLATMGPRPSEEQKREALNLPNTTLVESDFDLEWMEDPWNDVDAAARWLLNLGTNFSANIIHLNGYVHAALDWRKPVVVMAHSCVNSWWRAVHGCAPGVEWNEYTRRVRAGLAAADMIVAPSTFMATALEREYPIQNGRIRVIHNFCGPGQRREIRKQPFILAAGRIWDEAKNIALLDSIAPQLDWEVRLAGSKRGPENSITAGNGLYLLGALPQADLLSQMDRASIFAHPALYEPFGLSVLQAAGAKCCLVLSDIPSLRELWDGAAVFVNPRDPARWAAELNALATDAVRVEKLGQLAYAQSSKFLPATATSKYRNLYRLLVDRSRISGKETAA